MPPRREIQPLLRRPLHNFDFIMPIMRTIFIGNQVEYSNWEGRPFLPSSPNFELLTALNLLRLLAQNRLSEFHMTLESQNLSQIVNSKHLTYVLTLEQRLAEGSYHQILSSRQNVPSDEYLYFLEELEKTIRKEIAFCAEKAYKELTIADATAILCTPGKKHTVEIAKSNNWNMQLVEERILFDQWKLMDPTGGAEGGEIPCYEVMEKMLAYARSLETIV